MPTREAASFSASHSLCAAVQWNPFLVAYGGAGGQRRVSRLLLESAPLTLNELPAITMSAAQFSSMQKNTASLMRPHALACALACARTVLQMHIKLPAGCMCNV